MKENIVCVAARHWRASRAFSGDFYSDFRLLWS